MRGSADQYPTASILRALTLADGKNLETIAPTLSTASKTATSRWRSGIEMSTMISSPSPSLTRSQGMNTATSGLGLERENSHLCRISSINPFRSYAVQVTGTPQMVIVIIFQPPIFLSTANIHSSLIYASFKASTPTKVSLARKSNIAPPPVDTK